MFRKTSFPFLFSFLTDLPFQLSIKRIERALAVTKLVEFSLFVLFSTS
ncbi:Hypothetical protein Minf_0853 [Methylacidiphilum infernorum V4]|uniref:Uncharacterized protein n=1 Tax=Methylacidiphilum infernorum (isolate V4) TaxID=481448 RepID=B3E1B2_METI4|nr:Hypothetical protein Minf_0853 [Methylacidiphilum infernorum V4]